jgi:hypothetical protein
MHGPRSLNLELTPLDPDLERNIRRARRAQAEMGGNQREPRVEQHEEDQRKGHSRANRGKLLSKNTPKSKTLEQMDLGSYL